MSAALSFTQGSSQRGHALQSPDVEHPEERVQGGTLKERRRGSGDFVKDPSQSQIRVEPSRKSHE